MNTCTTCKSWEKWGLGCVWRKNALTPKRDWGDCSILSEGDAIDMNIDGGDIYCHVSNVSTPEDFGCSLWQGKEV